MTVHDSDTVTMSAKLKRTPLFGQDGHLGIPILSNNNKHKLVQVNTTTNILTPLNITGDETMP